MDSASKAMHGQAGRRRAASLGWWAAWPAALLVATLAAACHSESDVGRLGRVAWIRGDSLFSRALPSGAPRLLAVAGAMREPRWSPSGAWLALRTGSTLHLVRWNGSGGQKLSAEVGAFAWAPRDDRIAYVAGGNLIVARAGGLGVVLLEKTGSAAASGLAWSPDGAWIAVAIAGPSAPAVPTGAAPPRLLLIPTGGGPRRSLQVPEAPSAESAVIRGWTGDGADILVGIPAPVVPMATLPGAGMPVYALPVRSLTDAAGQAQPVADSRPGRLADSVLPYADFVAPAPRWPGVALVGGPGRATWRAKAVILAVGGTRSRVSAPGRAAISPAWTLDGGRLAWTEMPDADPPAGPEAGPSLDSRRIVVAEVSGGESGPARALGGEPGRQEAPRWAADGKHVVYVRVDSAGRTASLRLGAEHEPERTIVPRLSPPPFTGTGTNGYLPWSDVLDYWAGPPGRDVRVVR